MLVDAGPLIAICNENDKFHVVCNAVITSFGITLLTTEGCIVEAMYFAGKHQGFRGQQAIWNMIENHIVEIVETDQSDRLNSFELMTKYQDVPMDYADAGLVALAMKLNDYTIFTTDAHFHAYPGNRQEKFQVIPEL